VEFLLQSIWESLEMIARLDPELISALVTTLRVSMSSTAIAAFIALPLGFLVARYEFRGKGAIVNLLRTALALPTVVAGLFVYAFIARNAPLGEMKLLFTPAAIVIGQVLLIVPLITALVHAAVQHNVRVVLEEALLLGASPFQASVKALTESRLAVMTAIMTGFGRVVSEVGISLVLGGNIRGVTRTITTAITLETSQGDFAVAFALGLVLLALVLLVNMIIIQSAGDRREAL
jgi:tungstate transport system permease protein